MIIKKIFNKYSENYDRIKEIEIEKTDKIKSNLLGYLLSLVIIISPVIITAHFFIYAQYFSLCVFLISMFLATFFMLGELFAYKFLIYFCPNVKEISLKINIFVNSIGYYLLCLIAFVVIMLMR